MTVNYKFEMPTSRDVKFDSCGSVIGALMDEDIEEAVSIMENEGVSLTELYVYVHDKERISAFGDKNKNEEVRLYVLLADYMAMSNNLNLMSSEGIYPY